jgi:c-di-GMP-binding flagellar brake protein YcgR
MLSECGLLLAAIITELRSHNPGSSVHLTETDSAALKRFFILLLMVVVSVLFAAMVRTWRREQSRRARAAKKLEEFLASRGLTAQEKGLLFEVVRAGEEPADRVVKLVLSFDRGVDRYLAEMPPSSDEDGVLRLRRLKSLRAKLELDRVATGVPLLSTRELPVGQEILFRFNANPRGTVYAGLVLEYDDTGLLVEVHEQGGTSPEATACVGSDVNVYFLRRGDGGYRFHSRVLADVSSHAPGGGKTIWQIAHPRKLSREQRRHYLRIPVHEEIAFALVPQTTQPSAHDAPKLESLPLDRTGTLVDLSGGGFRMVSEGAPVQQDDLLVFRLPFLEAPLDRELLVARGMKVYKQAAEFGFTFEDLPSSTSAAIVRHVEAVHRQLRCVV